MKKRKIYEISVIDKTYSKIISDETKFYTSDTALELGFELKETEYNFESAEIVLLNIDDRSLVTRPVAKVLDSFTYELEDDITAHYGEWRGQLRFEQTGEFYVSSPVKFRLENDLSNDRPPQLSDVQSWVSLKKYADGLVDELKQAVLEVEGMDDTFNANELERQNQFTSAEQSRQTTFETAESGRDDTFESNETTRQSQELEREKAESQRQSVFDDNEVNRTETFNQNEATRQENETTRQQAETQRATAESSRASAEEQRKTDHANRSAELDGKADKVVIKNIVENGDFSQGATGWVFGNLSSDMVVSNGVSKVTSRYVSYSPYYSTSIDKDKKYFISSKIKNVSLVSSTRPSYALTKGNSVLAESQHMGNYFDEIDTEKFSRVSRVVTANNNYTSISLMKFTTNLSSPQNAYFDDVIFVNLTDTFGAGNEPTKEEMDELIKVTGYIDGEYALNNKEMLIWTLALIRRNKNAIITLGGA